jgi:hypothetical protein
MRWLSLEETAFRPPIMRRTRVRPPEQKNPRVRFPSRDKTFRDQGGVRNYCEELPGSLREDWLVADRRQLKLDVFGFGELDYFMRDILWRISGSWGPVLPRNLCVLR